jgi:hypothetical protein
MTDFRTLIREARSGFAIADQDLLDSLADAIQEEQRRADRAEAKLADAWDEGAEYSVAYSTAPLYDNPYRTEATA